LNALASGENLQDDVKLLKKTIKRIEKQKEKSKSAWTDRIDTVTNHQQERQKKRTENIKKRVDQKKVCCCWFRVRVLTCRPRIWERSQAALAAKSRVALTARKRVLQAARRRAVQATRSALDFNTVLTDNLE
jgi:CRISPR/Cas system-associated protein Csx1